jgi:hypothetical protein
MAAASRSLRGGQNCKTAKLQNCKTYYISNYKWLFLRPKSEIISMGKNYIKLIAGNLNLQPWQVENTLSLFALKATIPFISRYRKEMTGSLDEMQIAAIQEQNARYLELDNRREAVLKSIEEQGFMTDELMNKLQSLSWKTFICHTNPKRKQGLQRPGKRDWSRLQQP